MATCLACNKRTPKPREVAGHSLCVGCHKGAMETHAGDPVAVANDIVQLAQRKAAFASVGTAYRDRRD